MNREQLYNELKKKLQIIRLDLIARQVSVVDREFFWIAEPSGNVNGHTTYRTIDLSKEFPNKIAEFAKAHNVQAISTSKGFRFEKL